MRKVENLFSSAASTIVHNRLRKHTHKGRLARVHIADDSYACIILRSNFAHRDRRVFMLLKVLCLFDLADFIDDFLLVYVINPRG
jgi:hypothetical protein